MNTKHLTNHLTTSITAVLLLLAMAHSCFATSMAFIGATNGNAVANKYYHPDSFETGGTGNGGRIVHVATATTLDKLYVWAETAPGEGKSWTITVRDDTTGTAESATIANTDTSATDTDNVSIAANGKVTIFVTSSGSPAATRLYWAIVYTSNGQYLSGNFTNIATGTKYFNLKGYTASTSAVTRFVCPHAMTLTNFRCSSTADPGAGCTRTIALEKNGSTVDMPSFTYAEGETGTKTDDVTTVDIAAGDTLRIKGTITGAAANSTVDFWCIATPDTAGDCALFTGSYATTSPLGVTDPCYMPVNGSIPGPDDVLANVTMRSPGLTAKALYVVLNADPENGAGTQSFQIDLLEEGVASALSTTISEGATTGNDTDAGVTLEAGNAIALKFTPSGTPIDSEVPQGVSITARIPEVGSPAGAIRFRRMNQ